MPTYLLLVASIALLCLRGVQGVDVPAPPAWDSVFQFVAGSNATQGGFASSIYSYRYDIPAVLQVLSNPGGKTFAILNVKDYTWRVDYNAKECCLCTSPYACGKVGPPNPHWLQTGNETTYLGISTVAGRECEGWAKTNNVASFGWWLRTSDKAPCQLAWLFAPAVYMPISLYTNNSERIPPSLFEVPSYCAYHETKKDCSISGF